MRNPILLTVVHLVLFGPMTRSTAQTNFPFPDSAAVWVQSHYEMVTPPPLPSFQMTAWANLQVSGLDTMINGAPYSQVTDQLTGIYHGAVRSAAGVVWHVPVDSIHEFMLYDFTANAGDTVRNVVFYQGFPVGPGIFEPVVDDVIISQVYLEPVLNNRKVLELQSGGAWYEGIGSQWGLFTEPFINISNYYVQLDCMSHLDSIRFQATVPPPFDLPGTCALITASQAPEMTLENNAYPNPTDGHVLLDMSGSGTMDIRVTNALGHDVPASVARGPEVVQLDLSGLPTGLYLIHVQRDGRKTLHRISLMR
ncbi:MAG: T9SS type A sorting domain-containing protein [Flavobacteriales bacterium]|nr:T9SS type A sorting domain-containing protein [Flavobacteriales bacterium]